MAIFQLNKEYGKEKLDRLRNQVIHKFLITLI